MMGSETEIANAEGKSYQETILVLFKGLAHKNNVGVFAPSPLIIRNTPEPASLQQLLHGIDMKNLLMKNYTLNNVPSLGHQNFKVST